MGRRPCCNKDGKRGSWSPEEDAKLKDFIQTNMGNGGNWIKLPSKAGLHRCGKSCRLRWMNYLRPDIIRENFTEAEMKIIIDIQQKVGNRWSYISKHLPGRTDNDIKNCWNSLLKKKVAAKGLNSQLGRQQQSAYNRISAAQSAYNRISAAVPMFQPGLNLPLDHQQQCVQTRSPAAAVPMVQSETHASGDYDHQTMGTQHVAQFQQGKTRENQFSGCDGGVQFRDNYSNGNRCGDPPPPEDAYAWLNALLFSD